MGVFSDNFGSEFGASTVYKGEVGRHDSQDDSKALMLLPTVGCDISNNNPASTTSETKSMLLGGDLGIPKTLDELFQDYGIREGVALRLSEIGFCSNTLLSMSEQELEEAINTMCKECQVDLLLGERFGIKMACRAGRQLMESHKRERTGGAPVVLAPAASPSRYGGGGPQGWKEKAPFMDIEVRLLNVADREQPPHSQQPPPPQQQQQQCPQQQQQHQQQHYHNHQQQQQQQQQQQHHHLQKLQPQDCSPLKNLFADGEGGGRVDKANGVGRGIQTQSAGSSDAAGGGAKKGDASPPLGQLMGGSIVTDAWRGVRKEEWTSDTQDSVWTSKWARQHINSMVDEMVAEYLHENGQHGEVLDVRSVMADCDIGDLFRDNPSLYEAAVVLGDMRIETQSLKASVVSMAVLRLANTGALSLMGRDPATWASLPLYKQTFTKVADKGGSFSSLAEENGGGLSLDLNLSLDTAATKLYNDCGNSRGFKRKTSSISDEFDMCDVDDDLSSETQLGANEDRHLGRRFPGPDLERNLRTGEDRHVEEELQLNVTVRGEEAGPSWCSVDHLFGIFEDVIRAHQELQRVTGQQGLDKINSEVVAFARQVGLCSVRCGTLMRYLHCYALHVLDSDRSDAMRAMSKARGDCPRQWMALCCKSLLTVAGEWGWDMRRLFEMDAKLRHWPVPRKLLLLCALQKAKTSTLDPKLERRRQQGRIRQARYAAKKRAEAKRLQGLSADDEAHNNNNNNRGGGSNGEAPYGPLAVYMGPTAMAGARPATLMIPRTPSVETMLGAVSSAFSPVAGSSSAGPRSRAKRGKTSTPLFSSRPRQFKPPAFGFEMAEVHAVTSSGVLISADEAMDHADGESLANGRNSHRDHRSTALSLHHHQQHEHGLPGGGGANGAEVLDPRTERRRAQGRLRQARYAAKKRAASAMALMAGGGGGGGAGGGGNSA